VTRRERRSDDEPQICVFKKAGTNADINAQYMFESKGKGENDDQRMKIDAQRTAKV